MDIKPIKTEVDYRATLKEIESLMTADPGTPERRAAPIASTRSSATSGRSRSGWFGSCTRRSASQRDLWSSSPTNPRPR